MRVCGISSFSCVRARMDRDARCICSCFGGVYVCVQRGRYGGEEGRTGRWGTEGPYRRRLSTLSMLLSPESGLLLLRGWSVGERRAERVARSIWRLVCWCIRLGGV